MQQNEKMDEVLNELLKLIDDETKRKEYTEKLVEVYKALKKKKEVS